MPTRLKPTPKFSWGALERQLERTSGSKDRADIPGGFTADEYTAKYGVPYSTAIQRIRRMLSAGLVRKIGRYSKVTMLPDGGRKVALVWVYAVVPRAGQ